MRLILTSTLWRSLSTTMKRTGKLVSNTRTARNAEESESNDGAESQLLQFKPKSKPRLKRNHVVIKQDDSKAPKANDETETNDIKEDEAKQSTMPSTKRRKFKFSAENKPEHWEKVVENLRAMRGKSDAPVDSMGCDKCMDNSAEPKVQRYQSLLALMLSSRTKDEVTYAAMSRLKEHGCTVEEILKTDDKKLSELIYPVAFWKNKVRFIKKTAQILRDEYQDDIPNSAEGLCKLPGVGPKMAYICMKTAWGESTGIGVDTHVHRISNRLGWCNENMPEGTRKALEDWLPQELWSELNNLLVGFGQQVCKAINPQCGICLNKNICPFGMKQTKKSGNKA